MISSPSMAIKPENGFEPCGSGVERWQKTVLCAGPGSLCQALAITRHFVGRSLLASPFALLMLIAVEVCRGPRIGISSAIELLWRFGERGSVHLNQRFPEPAPWKATEAAFIDRC
ncbi:hypothetical protein E5S70_38190 [Ensifer adhaerens]|jgi:DNA-3-methyladenine glycosylase|nr:hypothetical protein [Ensifer canadensis]